MINARYLLALLALYIEVSSSDASDSISLSPFKVRSFAHLGRKLPRYIS